MKAILTADEAKKGPQKYCNIHGKQYRIDKDFSLCCHPDCFRATVTKMLKSSKIFQHILILDALDDFCSWLQTMLLSELRLKNKPPILNFSWARFKMMNYYSNILKKGVVPMESLPSRVRDERSYITIETEILEELNNINYSQTSFKSIKDNPERQLVAESYFNEVEELCGPIMLSYLLDELTIQDVARLNKTNLTNARKWVEDNKELLKNSIER